MDNVQLTMKITAMVKQTGPCRRSPIIDLRLKQKNKTKKTTIYDQNIRSMIGFD